MHIVQIIFTQSTSDNDNKMKSENVNKTEKHLVCLIWGRVAFDQSLNLSSAKILL